MQNPDILREISQIKMNQVVVGFAAETHDLEAEARRKLREKNLDFIVANDVTRKDAGFAVDTNQVTILSPDEKPERLPLLSKEEVAERILDRVAAILAGQNREGRGGVEDPVLELRELVASLSEWLHYQRRLGWRGLPRSRPRPLNPRIPLRRKKFPPWRKSAKRWGAAALQALSRRQKSGLRRGSPTPG